MNKIDVKARRAFILLVMLMLSLPFVCAVRIGWTDFDWFIKDAPPDGPSNFKVRTTGYWLALEEDWPVWYTGAPQPGSNACTVPISQRGFYEDVKCEGTGFTNAGKLIYYSKIQTTREASEANMYTPQDVISKKNIIKAVRPKRTIAVNPDKGTPCYIPSGSRVYIKYPDPTSPFTGWYVAQDTGGAFHGKCAIDIFLGVGKQTGPNPTVSKTDESQWPEVWVLPPNPSDDMWGDNVFTFILNGPSSGTASGQAGAAASNTTAKAIEASSAAGYKPTHPYFTVPYSVNPSFSVSIDYDFSIYDTAPKLLKKFERCKSDLDCIMTNISLIEQENPSLDWIVSYGGNVISKDAENGWEDYKWEAYCEKPDPWALNSLAEAMDTCANSKDKDCFCSYSLPVITPGEVDKWSGRKLSLGLFLIPGVGPLLGLASFAATELSTSTQWTERIFSLSQIATGVKISAKGKSGFQVVPGGNFKEVDSSWRGSSSKEFKYKIDDVGKNVSIYKDKNSNLSIYPEGKGSTRECEVNSKILKFCIVQNSTFMAYSAADNKLGYQQSVMRFAYVFRSDVTDISNFEVYDARYASNMSLLVWDPLEGADVASYTIYYSPDLVTEANLKGKSPAEAKEQGLLSSTSIIEFEDASKQEVDVNMNGLLNPACIVSSYICKLSYNLDTVTVNGESTADLSPGKLYYSRVAKKLFYIVPDVANDQKNYFAVTATGTAGEESPSFTTPVKQENSVDDIPPALAKVQGAKVDGSNVVLTIEPVTQNIDGTSLDPSSISFYRFYCFDVGVTSELNLSSKESAPLRATVVDPYLQLVMPYADFSMYCGGPATSARMIVTAVKKNGAEFKGVVSQESPAVYPIALT